MNFEKRFFVNIVKSSGGGANGGVWGVYLGAVIIWRQKFVNKNIGTYLSEDFRKHTQAKDVDSNLTNPLYIKARTT